MFAHQVIEDLCKLSCQLLSPGRSFIEEVISMIKVSQKFHAGDVDDIERISGHDVGSPMFVDDSILQLPYKIMWIDCTFKNYKHSVLPDYPYPKDVKVMSNSKEGVLVVMVTDNIWQVYCFSYNKDKGSWVPLLSAFRVYVGGITDKEKTVQNLLIEGIKYHPEHCSLAVAECALNLKILETTIKLLNCKNIETGNILAPIALNKKHRKAGKQEIFDYHVLNVVVPSKKRGYHESTEPLSHNRVHLCRGHFKEYTAEHPLFGRYTGLYWWQPHVRGQNRDGVIMKNYNVTARQEATQ